MDYEFLAGTPLFCDMSASGVAAALEKLRHRTAAYDKGGYILRAGNVTDELGILLSGRVMIESDDVWGNRSILDHIEAGQIFAEAYALSGEPLMISAVAAEPSEVLFLSVRSLIGCNDGSAGQLINNLLKISANKNLALSRRIFHTSPKTIRGRLMSYFSEQLHRSGSSSFTIPFNRQQLADYLGVDRSALSAELSRLRREGIIDCHRSSFTVNGKVKNI